jgi:hypothetical protein
LEERASKVGDWGSERHVINTNALNILTRRLVIASPKGVAISFFVGLLRRPAPRNDKLLNASVLVNRYWFLGKAAKSRAKRAQASFY